MDELENTHQEEPRAEERRSLPRWKKIALLVAVVFVVLGAGLGLASGGSEKDSAAETPAGSTELSNGLAPQGLSPGVTVNSSGTGTLEGQDESSLESWSPFFIKNGLSFFVAFCIGYALRTFFKVSAGVLGVIFLAIFGLSYAGIVDIDWTTLEGYWDSFASRVSEETKQFKTFVMGSLPSASLGALGLVAGFRR